MPTWTSTPGTPVPRAGLQQPSPDGAGLGSRGGRWRFYSSRHGRRDLKKRSRRAAHAHLWRARPAAAAARHANQPRGKVRFMPTAEISKRIRPPSLHAPAFEAADRITRSHHRRSGEGLQAGIRRPSDSRDSRHLLEITLEHRLLSGASARVDAMVAVLDAKSGFDAVAAATAISRRAYSPSRLDSPRIPPVNPASSELDA